MRDETYLTRLKRPRILPEYNVRIKYITPQRQCIRMNISNHNCPGGHSFRVPSKETQCVQCKIHLPSPMVLESLGKEGNHYIRLFKFICPQTIKAAHIATVRKLPKPPHLIMRIMDCVLILFRKRLDQVVFDAERNCCKPSWSESLKVTPLFSSPKHMICLYNSNQIQK